MCEALEVETRRHITEYRFCKEQDVFVWLAPHCPRTQLLFSSFQQVVIYLISTWHICLSEPLCWLQGNTPLNCSCGLIISEGTPLRITELRASNIFVVVVFFLLGDSPAPEFCVPTFRNILFHLLGWCKQEDRFYLFTRPMKMELTECSETSAHKIQKPGNHPKERIKHSQHGESLKSRILVVITSQFKPCLKCLYSDFLRYEIGWIS